MTGDGFGYLVGSIVFEFVISVVHGREEDVGDYILLKLQDRSHYYLMGWFFNNEGKSLWLSENIVSKMLI